MFLFLVLLIHSPNILFTEENIPSVQGHLKPYPVFLTHFLCPKLKYSSTLFFLNLLPLAFLLAFFLSMPLDDLPSFKPSFPTLISTTFPLLSPITTTFIQPLFTFHFFLIQSPLLLTFMPEPSTPTIRLSPLAVNLIFILFTLLHICE